TSRQERVLLRRRGKAPAASTAGGSPQNRVGVRLARKRRGGLAGHFPAGHSSLFHPSEGARGDARIVGVGGRSRRSPSARPRAFPRPVPTPGGGPEHPTPPPACKRPARRPHRSGARTIRGTTSLAASATADSCLR